MTEFKLCVKCKHIVDSHMRDTTGRINPNAKCGRTVVYTPDLVFGGTNVVYRTCKDERTASGWINSCGESAKFYEER